MCEVIVISKTDLERVLEETIRRVLLEQKKETPEQSDIITITEVMELSGYAKQSVYGMVNKGAIPYIRKGGRTKLHFSRKAILAWLAEEK